MLVHCHHFQFPHVVLTYSTHLLSVVTQSHLRRNGLPSLSCLFHVFSPKDNTKYAGHLRAERALRPATASTAMVDVIALPCVCTVTHMVRLVALCGTVRVPPRPAFFACSGAATRFAH
ncbi:hypothetical protein TRVL_05421 [Trypanosoma vivax]|nr:hypothetical protein TRVL_05421 [Trypanosoma vivax]